MDTLSDLIPTSRYLSKITSVQVRRDYNNTVYFALVHGRIVEGERRGEFWMDILRPAHTVPVIEKMDGRKLDELLAAANVEDVLAAKGKIVGVGIGIRGDENTIVGYWPSPEVSDAVQPRATPPASGEMAELEW
jgi:hypothetical protein